MAVYEVFAHPELRRYKTHICSKATLLQFAVLFLTFIPPLFVVYRSHGFWQREDYYREFPDITFKRQLLVNFQLLDGGYLTWSTFQSYNKLQQGSNTFRIPFVKNYEVDSNGNGRFDKLVFNLELPLTKSEDVISVSLLLFYQYKLYKFSSFWMECMSYIHYSSAAPGAMLQAAGDLKVRQKQPLGHRNIDTRFNDSIINQDSVFVKDFDLFEIFKNYSARNVSTVLGNQYVIWQTGRGAIDPFIIQAEINYPEDIFLYTPGFWYLMKWGWIQYVAVLLIFLFLFDRIKVFIFQNQLVNTIVDRPLMKAKAA